jgi:hypothetical protein
VLEERQRQAVFVSIVSRCRGTGLVTIGAVVLGRLDLFAAVAASKRTQRECAVSVLYRPDERYLVVFGDLLARSLASRTRLHRRCTCV